MFNQTSHFPARTLLVALVVVCGFAGFAETSSDRATVHDLLMKWHDSNMMPDVDVATIKRMPKSGLPLLGEYLGDKELGLLAESAMVQIDSMAAAPYLLRNLPNRDRNIQRWAFRSANLLIRQCELSHVARPQKADPNRAPERWPMNTRPYPYMREIHDVAVRLALADVGRDAEAEIVQSIGLTGSRRDVPLLHDIEKRCSDVGWLCVAAEARLGDRQALDTIAEALERPVESVPEEPYYRDTGRRVDPQAGRAELRASATDWSGFQDRFIDVEDFGVGFTLSYTRISPCASSID